MYKFIFSTILLIAGIYATVYLAVQRGWLNAMPSFTVEIIVFLGGTTVLLFIPLIKRSRSLRFTQAYLVSMVLKMLTYLIFILIVIYYDRPGATPNAALFIVSYILFTALEVGFLFQSVNR